MLMSASPSVVTVPRLDSSFASELASQQAVGGWVATTLGGEDVHPSELLRTKSERGWRVGELYDRMISSDLDLAGYIGKRLDAVLTLPRWIRPADSSPAALEVAEFCRAALSQIKGFDINLRHQLESRPKGLAIDELLWERLSRGPLAGAWMPVAAIDRPMWRFKFKAGQLFVRRLSGSPDLVAHPAKFLAMRFGTKDSPWGRGFLEDLYWHWYLKKNGLKFFAVFLDKWAQPTAIGKYRHQSGDGKEKLNEEAQRDLLAAIEAIQSEYGVTLPEGLTIDLLEATRSGSANYESFLGVLNRSMANAILGEVDTSGAAKGPGSFAKAEVSNAVRKEKVTLDAHDLSAHLRDHLLAPLVAVNFGPDVAVPRFEIDAIEAEDRKLRQEGAAAVLAAGLPVPRRDFYAVHLVREPAEGEEVVRSASPAAPVPPVPPADPAPLPQPPVDPDQHPADPEPSLSSSATAVQLAAPPSPPADSDFDAELAEIEAAAEDRVASFDEMVQAQTPASLDYYQGWRDILAAAWDDGAVANGTALRRLVGRLDPVAHARHLETAQIHGAGLALLHLTQDLGGTAPLLFALPPGWESAHTPSSAVDYWSSVTSVPKEAFALLTDSNRRLAFTVAGVEDAALLLEIHRLVGQAMAEGWVRERFVRELDTLFRTRGLDPLARWHAELIYMNNVRQAAAVMRYRQLVGNPAAKRLTPYLIYLSLDDGRVRPKHQAMHKHIAAVDHEIWKTWWTPAGHACRCTIETINLAKARRMGLTGSEPMGPWPQFEGANVMPDEGFGGMPDLGSVADTMETRARQLGEDARAGGEDVAEAMRQLLTQLLGGI